MVAVLAKNAVDHILVRAGEPSLQDFVNVVFRDASILGTDHVGKFVVEFRADFVLRSAEHL